MPSVKIVKTTVANGKDVFPGDVVEVEKREAHLLIRMGKAEEIKPQTPVKGETEQKKADKKASKEAETAKE